MKQIHEPQDVDFYVDPRPLTPEEKNRISEYIKKDKEERNGRPTKTKSKRAKDVKTKRKSKQQA